MNDPQTDEGEVQETKEQEVVPVFDQESDTANESAVCDVVSVEPSTDDVVRERLDCRVITLWRLESALACGFLCLVMAIVGTILWIMTPIWKIAIIAAWSVGIALFLFNVAWWPARSHARWSYCLRDKTLELSHGIAWHVDVLIPLTRIQHVDLHRSPFEQRFDLATLVVHTAGTRDASHRLPGLEVDVANHLREQLATAANLRLS